eukprot:TRINITY_DN11712_c0_g1_i1.p1 TRINITY_DN11712_c0_g1~~TRINITY_DN11712_c0_g1_i1.p1  ORF type:complete len:272 (+),score=84.14 TRINITY_DN11712_c0_g1_i1:141-956(+)
MGKSDSQAESGHLGNLSDSEAETLKKFTQSLQEWRKNNHELAQVESLFRKKREAVKEEEDVINLKFLRARNFNHDVSFKMFCSFIQWRKDFQGIGVDNVTKDTCIDEIRKGKTYAFGNDINGRPILWLKAKLHSKRESESEELQRLAVYTIESLNELLRPPQETVTMIIDLKGFSMDNMDMNIAKFLTTLTSDYYPESLGQALILDAPWLFYATWKVISLWLDAKTASKIKFGTPADVAKLVPEEYLPEEYGGKVKVDVNAALSLNEDEKI